MPDSLRDVWSGPRGELSQIEFHPPTRDPSVDLGESWLTGRTPAIERLRARATKLGRDGAAVVSIHGEAGAGKLRVAQWIHRCSNRSDRPLSILDGDDPRLDLQLERVLLTLGRPLAPGTVVLRNCDRMGDGSLERLLDILGRQGVELSCALVLMSKRSPERLRDCSPIHDQLLARAGGMLSLPSLRHRGPDIAELARQFVSEAAHRYDKSIRGLSPQAISRLEACPFPGNVRELQIMIEQAVLRSNGDWITADCFGAICDDGEAVRHTDEAELVIRLPGSSLREIEMEALRLALTLSEGRVVRAAELLGITRHALRRKLEKFGLTDLRANPGPETHDDA